MTKINTNGLSMNFIVSQTETLAEKNKASENGIVTTQTDGQLSLQDAKQAIGTLAGQSSLSETDKKLKSTLEMMVTYPQIFVNSSNGADWGNAQVISENITKVDPDYKNTVNDSPGSNPIATKDGYFNLTQISHEGQWKAVTGGDINTPLTLDRAKAALTDPKVSAETKASTQWVVNNWNTIAGGPDKTLTLGDAQKLGTTPAKSSTDLMKTPEAYLHLTTISHGPWEALTCGTDTPLTLDKARAAIGSTDPRLSSTKTQDAIKWVVANWATVAGGNDKTLTLGQTQVSGTTPFTPSDNAIKTPEAYKSLTTVSHDGQWEHITGGTDNTMTYDAAEAAKSNPATSEKTKKALEWLTANWNLVTGDKKKPLTLEQARTLGTTPK